ncbi:MAG: rhodanese-like domain-containing protein [Polyangiaceae bacterium]|nr:rhodanese-like domain-containing protein [Polyangiaceae bacterium]
MSASGGTVQYAEWDVSEVHGTRGRIRIVDVREPDEYCGAVGHIEGAELIPLGTLAAALDSWDKTAPVILVCRSGGRSARAAGMLITLGFERPINMTGGMLAWNARSLPVAR